MQEDMDHWHNWNFTRQYQNWMLAEVKDTFVTNIKYLVVHHKTNGTAKIQDIRLYCPLLKTKQWWSILQLLPTGVSPWTKSIFVFLSKVNWTRKEGKWNSLRTTILENIGQRRLWKGTNRLCCLFGQQNLVRCQRLYLPSNPSGTGLVCLKKALVEVTLSSVYHRASLFAASTQHSGDWLFALPITSCGLKLDDEVVRVAVGLRLDLRELHQCQCGSVVDARGLHSFVCKRAPGRSARHYALNDLVACSFAAAGVPVTKEPAGLSRTDGKWPDGLTLVPWQSGKSLYWDVTVICPLAESYVNGAAREAGAAAEVATSR